MIRTLFKERKGCVFHIEYIALNSHFSIQFDTKLLTMKKLALIVPNFMVFSGALWLFKQEFRLNRSWYSYSIGMFRNPAFIQRYVTKRTGQKIQHWIPWKRSWTSQILAKSCAGNCQIKINSEVDPTTFQEILQFHRKRLYVQVYGLAQNSLQIWPRTLQVCFIFIKFIYSEKTTIIWKKNPIIFDVMSN